MGNSLLKKATDEQKELPENIRLNARVVYNKKRLHLFDDEMYKFYTWFRHYTEDDVMNINNYYKFIDDEQSVGGDEMLKFVGVNSILITFPQFMDVICTFCMFESTEILKFIFRIYDLEGNGYADFTEIKTFIGEIHRLNKETTGKQNVIAAIKYLESKASDGIIYFSGFREAHMRFPMIFYPVFRLQICMMMATFGEYWWEKRKRIVAQDAELQKLLESGSKEAVAMLKQKQEEELVLRRLGVVKYYFMPWKRAVARNQLHRIAVINDELEALVASQGNVTEQFEEVDDPRAFRDTPR